MHPKEVFNKALVAASVADASGYPETSAALLEIAEWLMPEERSFDRKAGLLASAREKPPEAIDTIRRNFEQLSLD